MTIQVSPEELETHATYEALATNWDSLSDAHWKDETWYAFTSRLEPRTTVLDLGCGTARDGEAFLEDGFGYIGVDFSPSMLKIAKQRLSSSIENGQASLYVADIANLSLPFIFKAFWAATTFMHIPRAKLPQVLTNLIYILESGAVGFISIPRGDDERMYEGNNGVGCRALCVCWQPESFMRVLVASGFEVIYWEQVASMLHFTVRKI